MIELLDLGRLHAAFAERLQTAWRSVLVSGRFMGRPEVETFEAEFARYCEAAGCVSVANGTDALERVLSAMGIGQNDEVIVPANTLVATVAAVCAVGARPQFVDVRHDTPLLDPAAAEAAVGPRTAAVVAVHLYGQMGDMSALSALADRHGLALVEDAAQAPGSPVDGRAAWASPPRSASIPARISAHSVMGGGGLRRRRAARPGAAAVRPRALAGAPASA